MSGFKDFASGFKKGFMEFGHAISTIVNTVLLVFVYIIGVGPTSIVAKLAGKRFLEMKIEKEKESYWSELNLKKKETKDYYKQF